MTSLQIVGTKFIICSLSLPCVLRVLFPFFLNWSSYFKNYHCCLLLSICWVWNTDYQGPRMLILSFLLSLMICIFYLWCLIHWFRLQKFLFLFFQALRCFLLTVFPIYLSAYTGCNMRNVRDFGRVFLRSNYTDITQNTYIQSWTVMEIMAGEVWNFDSCYSLIDYQIHIETGRNMWFL